MSNNSIEKQDKPHTIENACRTGGRERSNRTSVRQTTNIQPQNACTCITLMCTYVCTHKHTHTHTLTHTHKHTHKCMSTYMNIPSMQVKPTCCKTIFAFCLWLTEASASLIIWCIGILPKLSLNPRICKRLRLKLNVMSTNTALQAFLMLSFCEQHSTQRNSLQRQPCWSFCPMIYILRAAKIVWNAAERAKGLNQTCLMR